MKNLKFIILATIFFTMSCKNQVTEKVYQESEIKSESKKANLLFEEFYNAYTDRHPMVQSYLGIKKDYDKWDNISDSMEQKELEVTQKELETLRKDINYDALDAQTKLSCRLFEYNANQKIEGFKYRFHNYPVNQLFGLHSEVPSFLINIHQVTNVRDAEAYIERLKGLNPLFIQLVENVQLRAEKGIIPPKFVFPQVIEDCRNILQGAPFEKGESPSTLLEDITSKVSNLKDVDERTKKELIGKAEYALVASVGPAYKKLIVYLEELEKKATTEDGAWKFPDGNNFYQFALKQTTTTNLSSDEIFQTGEKEVARIKSEMQQILKKVNYQGDLKSFFQKMRTDKSFYYPNDAQGKKEYLEKAVHIIDSMKGRLDELFITKPKADIIVKAVEPFREKSTAGAFYQEPAPDGSRPGIYYANLYDMNGMPKYEMEALAYHEGIPGHHMQLAIAQELQDVPKFRKYGSYTAYIEGWGLYSEFIPKEMGYYSDPYSDFGRLSMELWRACRLVVDVGIHNKKWTREQGIQYFLDNTPNSELDCRKEIERYIVWPSQATAYKIGMLKILELREKAKKELGNKFDIRKFHDVVLVSGAVPLDILEELVDDFISKK